MPYLVNHSLTEGYLVVNSANVPKKKTEAKKKFLLIQQCLNSSTESLKFIQHIILGLSIPIVRRKKIKNQSDLKDTVIQAQNCLH